MHFTDGLNSLCSICAFHPSCLLAIQPQFLKLHSLEINIQQSITLNSIFRIMVEDYSLGSCQRKQNNSLIFTIHGEIFFAILAGHIEKPKNSQNKKSLTTIKKNYLLWNVAELRTCCNGRKCQLATY